MTTAVEHLEDIQDETGVDSDRLRVLTLDYIDETRQAYLLATYIRKRLKEEG